MIAHLLKLRQKLHNKREALTQDEEKPFLEHLEDLRKTLTRLVLTLVISVLVCFAFNSWFFKVMYEPAVSAGLSESRERKLPESLLQLDPLAQQNTWRAIHEAARGSANLAGADRERLLKYAAPDAFAREMAQALLLHHYSSMVPAPARSAWQQEATAALSADQRPNVIKYLTELQAAGTSTDLATPTAIVTMEALAPAEGFMISMKLSLFAGIVVAFPLLFYFLLEFILPGLTARERKVLWPALSIGFSLFLIGVLFAYFFVVPRALEYFNQYSADIGIIDRWRIGSYISFVTTFTLIFGVAFELPVVVMVLVKLGLIGFETMNRTRSYAVIIILVASALLTPTGDMLTMSMLAAPMVIMYEACIWFAWLHDRKEKRIEAEEAERSRARRATLVGVATVPAASPPSRGENTEQIPSPDPDPDPFAAYQATYGLDHESPPLPATAEDEDTSPWHPHEQEHDAQAEYEQYLRDAAGYPIPPPPASELPLPEPPAASSDTSPDTAPRRRD